MGRLDQVVKLRFMHGEAEIVRRFNLVDAKHREQTAHGAQGFEIIARIRVIERHHRKVGGELFHRHQGLLLGAQRHGVGEAVIEFRVGAGFFKFAFGARIDGAQAGVGDIAVFAGATQESVRGLIAKPPLLAGESDLRALLAFVDFAGAFRCGCLLGEAWIRILRERHHGSPLPGPRCAVRHDQSPLLLPQEEID